VESIGRTADASHSYYRFRLPASYRRPQHRRKGLWQYPEGIEKTKCSIEQEVNKPKKSKKLKMVVTAADNHYAGFGPGTSNMFRKLIGLEEATFKDEKQATLSDF